MKSATSTSPTPASSGARDADTMLADAAETYKHAVGVVVCVLPKVGAKPLGTAWAFGPTLFATNAHVVELMEKIAAKVPGAPFFVAINQRPDRRLRIVASRKHPRYSPGSVRFDGQTALATFDMAVLRTSEPAPAHFPLASRNQLQALRSGSRIAFLGFPMESLENDNIDVQNPIATMQSGIVTSLSDSFLSDSGFEGNRLVRHNLPAVGGASGSAIFTPDGVVVAILWGVSFEPSVTPTESGGLTQRRSANAALINFAERIDGLAEISQP